MFTKEERLFIWKKVYNIIVRIVFFVNLFYSSN